MKLRERLVQWVLAVLLAMVASPSSGAEVTIASPATPGRWVLVEIDALPAGEAMIDGGAGETTWPHRGGRIAVPVLLPPDVPAAWTLTINGERIVVPVEIEPAEGPLALSGVMPRAYDAVLAWRPARPLRERATIVGIAGVACVLIAGIVTGRKRFERRWLLPGLALLVALATATGLVLWREVRPAVATRQVVVPVVVGQPLVDGWRFHVAPDRSEPVMIELPAAGYTTPIGYSLGHLRSLRPMLRCDANGTPVSLQLTLPPGGVAATVQRVKGHADAELPPWARPLLRRVYRRR